MADRLRGKSAIVFGAGSSGPGWGNGKAAAVLYAREGAKVACVDLDIEAAGETAAIIAEEGGEAIAIAADVTALASIEAAVAAARQAYGTLSILHNNVGVTHMGGPVELSEAQFQQSVDLNLGSVFRTAKAVIPHMIEAGGGVNQATVAIAVQYARQGIRANCVVPGLIDTPLIYKQISSHYASTDEMVAARNAALPSGHMGDAWDVANAALFLASDEAKFINGVCLPVDGGQSCTIMGAR
ncbi:3-oxoacyl-ACP reductase [Sinorhizobium medicae]|nr:3-oxoacyl-ACP reductase [Sinorhizobium medicae]